MKMHQKRPEGALKIFVYNPGALRRFCTAPIAASSLRWSPNKAQQATSVRKGKNMEEWINKRSEKYKEHDNKMLKRRKVRVEKHYSKTENIGCLL